MTRKLNRERYFNYQTGCILSARVTDERRLYRELDKIGIENNKEIPNFKSMYKHRYFVYILACSDKSYYVGVTNNLERRLKEHEEGINPDSYTHNRRPLELKWYEEFKYIDKAIEFEKKIKNWSRAKKQALIEGMFDKLPELSIKKFEK